jgi:very-short-patch-repair endonuclease
MSLPEVLLWRELRQGPGGFKFRRQCPQESYILDFACLETRLAIEVDGESHGLGDRPERDERRDARLRELGFTTFRLPARDVLQNLEGMIAAIVEQCRASGPLHQPSAGPPPRAGEDL